MARNVHRLFKHGIDFQLKSVDYSSQKAKKKLDQLKRKQEEVGKAAVVDSDALRKIKFTI